MKNIFAAACFTCCMCAVYVDAARGSSRQAATPKAPRHPLTHIPARAGRVESTFHFPDYPGGKKLPIGPPVTVLCHLKNGGKLPINVTSIMGSLNGHRRFWDYIQNFTMMPMQSFLKPDEEMTLAYTFSLSKGLEPEKYEMAHTVFYDREDRHFANTFFNKTVDTYLAGGHSWDLESVLTVFALLACTALFCGLFSLILFPETAMAFLGKSTAAAETAAAGGNDGKSGAKAGAAGKDDDEWVKIQQGTTKQRKIKK